MSETIVLLYVTCKDVEEAKNIAGSLLRQKLAACVNIMPHMESLYFWKGELQSSKEVVLIVKTTQEKCDMCADRIRALHSYELPCVLPISADGQKNPFAQWVRECVEDA
jgi:periplasmic divalent cation tolerance protein